ncbi:hypothetical protein [Undibacterium pigrum]|uniref:Uncharacterized protein n=1 Tax=Undibacterium pigrum TaxID=401470 RepID=A0A318JS85_9BURK|nr:hypothetical protein [Undibacterium pigrum]PXX47220.1 hypothetical protein DFR42_101797 [Undibacterium pigrum]
MNIAKKTNLTLLTICVFAATIVSVATYINKLAVKANIPTVTISAQRLTEQQKIAFDVEQAGHTMQTVFIAAKRLSLEEKFALDQQDRQNQQAKVRVHKKPQLLV